MIPVDDAHSDQGSANLMGEDIRLPFDLPAVARKKVSAAFDGGRITSDGGVMLLAQAERRLAARPVHVGVWTRALLRPPQPADGPSQGRIEPPASIPAVRPPDHTKSAIDFRRVIHKRLTAGEPRTFNPHFCAWG
jgi:hypothetical protein